MNSLKIIFVLLSIAFTSLGIAQTVRPIFKGSSRLADPYGMCAHFTFTDKKADNTTLEEQSAMLRNLECNIVRSDLTCNMVNNSNTAILDRTLKVLGNCKLGFLGIATDPRFFQSRWDENDQFSSLLSTLRKHYIKGLSFLELQNEVNYSKVPSLGHHYTDDLKALYGLKKSRPKLNILFSGIGDTHYEVLDSIMKYGANRYFDIMNFHTYLSPEDTPSFMNIIKANMDKYHWNKPIWMTEYGMHTAKYNIDDTNYAFFTKVVPHSLSKCGISLQHLTVGVINDVPHAYCSLEENEINEYIIKQGWKCAYLSLDQLKSTSPKDVPVLILAQTESFYSEYFPSLLEYVKKGGTIVLPYGAPFYYDSTINKAVGKAYANQLHIGQLFYWDGDAKRLKAPQNPTYYRANENFGIQYSFYKPGNGMTPRYLTEALLQGKDKMTPISFAGDSNYRGATAALYQLNSDLRGNIIIQTRMGTQRLVNLEDEQARRVARIHLIAFAYGVDKVFWYKFRSNELDPYYSEDNFGMVHADLSPKPAYYAYKTLIRMLPNGSTRPVLRIKNGIYMAEWKRPDGRRVSAYWCKDGFSYYQIVANPYNFYDYMGKSLSLTDGRIKVFSGVVYAVEKY